MKKFTMIILLKEKVNIGRPIILFGELTIWGEKDGTMTYSNNNSEEFLLTYKGSLKELSSVKTLRILL